MAGKLQQRKSGPEAVRKRNRTGGETAEKAGLATAVRKRIRPGGERKSEREIVGKKPERPRTVMVPGKGRSAPAGNEEPADGVCQGSVLPVGLNRGEICRTNAG